MVHDAKCRECGSGNWDESKLESRGEVSCKDCGVVLEDFVLDSSPAPLREGDDTRSRGPIRKRVSVQNFDRTLRPGDRVWNLPSVRKRGYSRRKKQAKKEIEKIQGWIDENKEIISHIDSKIKTEQEEQSEGFEDRIVELKRRHRFHSEEVQELERDSVPWTMILNSTLPPTKDSEWIYKHEAKDFLGLGPTEHEQALADRIKELDPSVNWLDLVEDIISNPGLPDRAPISEEEE